MVSLGNDWDKLLASEFSSDYYLSLREFLKSEYFSRRIYPPMNDIFNALRYTSYENTRVVILGQDPYHGYGQAHGLCFSVKEGTPPPPSLKNIFKELKDALFHIIETGEAVAIPANFLSFVFCGFMWGISLIVPGLSSSTVLIFLGLYVPLTEGIGGFDMSVLLPFGVGIVITVLLFAKLINMLFKKHYAVISRIILGFVISSSLKTLPHEFGSVWTMIISIICCVIGFIIAIAMEKTESKQKH